VSGPSAQYAPGQFCRVDLNALELAVAGG